MSGKMVKNKVQSVREPANAWTPHKVKKTKSEKKSGPTFTNILKAKNRKRQHPEPYEDNWPPYYIYEIIYQPTSNVVSSTTRNKTPKVQTSEQLKEFRKKVGERITKLTSTAKEKFQSLFQNISSCVSSLKRTKNIDQQDFKMKDIILALVTRVLFGSHALIAIWRAYTEYNNITMWLLLVPVGLLILEALFTVGARGGEEYKWVSPCVLLYLASVIPSIWFLELKNFERREDRPICNDLHWGITSQPGCLKEFKYAVLDFDVETVLKNVTLRKKACEEEFAGLNNAKLNESIWLQTTTTIAEPDTTTQAQVAAGLDNVIGTLDQGKKALDDLMQNINFFNEQTWILVLHQLLLFFLIVGRWLLPTGEGISRDQLSQLLLVFIGVGADILEFVTETIKEIEVRCDRLLLIIIMGFWSWSTLQFSLVLTASKARRTRAVGIYEGEDEENESPSVVVVEEKKPGACMRFWKNMEVWGIFSTLILQDGPFLATRLYIMAGRGVVHQMIVFFTTKNALVVILQLYRLSIIGFHKPKDEDEDDKECGVAALGALQGAVVSGIDPKQIGGKGMDRSQDKDSQKEDSSRSMEDLNEDKVVITTVDESLNKSANNSNNKPRSNVAFIKVR